MRINKTGIGLLLSLSILFLSSCGIPSYLQCDVTFTAPEPDADNKQISGKITICNVYINATESDGIWADGSVVSESPSFTFFYSLSESITEDTSLTKRFNSLYSSENGRTPKSASLTINPDGYILETGSDSKAVRLYPFTVEGDKNLNSWISPSGHINKTMTGSHNLDEYIFDYSALEKDGYLILKYNDSNGVQQELKLKRYKGNLFYRFDDNKDSTDYINLTDSSTTQIGIYVAVNIVGSDTANFNNRFWSDLYFVGAVEATKSYEEED